MATVRPVGQDVNGPCEFNSSKLPRLPIGALIFDVQSAPTPRVAVWVGGGGRSVAGNLKQPPIQ